MNDPKPLDLRARKPWQRKRRDPFPDRVCEYAKCRQSFEPVDKRQRFCSGDHRQKEWNRMHPRISLRQYLDDGLDPHT